MKGSGEENEEQAPDYCLGWYIDVVIGSDFNPIAGAGRSSSGSSSTL